MKELSIFSWTIGLFLLGSSASILAQGLTDVLVSTYQSNPAIKASRALLRSEAENLPITQAGYLPTLAMSLNEGRSHIRQDTKDSDSSGSVSSDLDEITTDRSASLNLNLNLSAGGATAAEVRAARAGVEAQIYAVYLAEQTAFQEAADYFAKVLQYSRLLTLAEHNLQDMLKLKQQAEAFFDHQQITITDVSQVRVKVAIARRAIAEYRGELGTATSSLRMVSGLDVGPLTETQGWPVLPSLPSTLERALHLGANQNPSILQYNHLLREQQHNIATYKGEHLPSVDLYSKLKRQWDSSTYTSSEDYKEHETEDTWDIGITVNVPLYSGGETSAYVRQAEQDANESRYSLRNTQLTVENSIKSDWSTLSANNEMLESADAEIAAALSVVEGFERQFQSGTSTMQSVLIARQDLYSANVSKVTLEYGVFSVTVDLLASIGGLNADSLRLPIEVYDLWGAANQAGYIPQATQNKTNAN
ncbi:MAG: TolC family protein [Gammaproteobacteria bacterium]|nr:TolC family protein [Gammaproteobacteria bacterium]